MNLFELLKQFKNIEPDANFKERSKRAIMAFPQEPAGNAFHRMRGVWGMLEGAMALVLVGFFIILVTGSFPGTSSLTPVQYSVIDPQGLHAEAQAIDMQIQLTNLNYTETTPLASSAGAPKNGAAHPLSAAPKTGVNPGVSGAASATTSTATSTVSLDQALQLLMQ